MSYLKHVDVRTQDSPSVDAFGRWRVSNPETHFDSKLIFDNDPFFWDDVEFSGSGTSSTHSAATASVTLGVSNTTAGSRVRQTFMRFNYQPGKSQMVMMTGVLNKTGGGTGITRRIGLFDANNGLFFEDAAGAYKVVRRTAVTGSPVDNTVAQSSLRLQHRRSGGNGGFMCKAVFSECGY